MGPDEEAWLPVPSCSVLPWGLYSLACIPPPFYPMLQGCGLLGAHLCTVGLLPNSSLMDKPGAGRWAAPECGSLTQSGPQGEDWKERQPRPEGWSGARNITEEVLPSRIGCEDANVLTVDLMPTG